MNRKNSKQLRLQLPTSLMQTTPESDWVMPASTSLYPGNPPTYPSQNFRISSCSGANLNLEETLKRRSSQHQNRLQKDAGIQLATKLVYKYAARSLSELYDKCTAEEWAALVYASPINFQRCVTTSLELYIKDCLELQRLNRWEWLLAHSKFNEFEEREILRLFTSQHVDPVFFAACLKSVLTCELSKINTIKITGVPNSGKTLIAQLIASLFISCYANNHGSENEFFLSNFLNKSLILCEELYVTRATCEDFKSILGGVNIDISKKYQEKQILSRTPVIITSNYEQFGRGHLPHVDEHALNNRCFNFYFGTEFVPACQISAPSFAHFLFLAVNQEML